MNEYRFTNQGTALPQDMSCAHMGCFKLSSMSHVLSLHCECGGLQDVDRPLVCGQVQYSPNEGTVMNTIQ